MKPIVQLILGALLLATIACFATKNSDPFFMGMVFAVIAGFGYLIHA